MNHLKVSGIPYEGDLFRKRQYRAGYDIVQHINITFKPYIFTRVLTNVRFPEGLGKYFALLTLRSSYQGTGLMMPGTGVIDGDYTDHIFYTLYNESSNEIHVNEGDRIVQLVFIPLQK